MEPGISLLVPAADISAGPSRLSLWAEGLLRAAEYLEGCGRSWEIIAFGRPQEAEAMRGLGLIQPSGLFRWVKDERPFQAALAAAKFPVAVLFPADGGIPLKECELLDAELNKGRDIVWGSRFKKGQSIAREGTSRARIALEWVRSAAGRFAGSPVSDAASGFGAFRRGPGCRASEWAPGVSEKKVSASDLARAARMGLKFGEVGIMWAPR